MNKVQSYVETVLQPKLQGDGGWVLNVGRDIVATELTLVSFARERCS